MTSPDFWTVLRSLAIQRDTSEIVFELLERGTAGTPSAIMADNYDAAIAVLSDFASASWAAAVPKSGAAVQAGKRTADMQGSEYDIDALTLLLNH